FIGINILNEILAVRDDCFAITHDAMNAWRLKLSNTPFKNIVHCDITSYVSVKNLIEKYRPKTIFNLAAYGAYSKQRDVRLIYETNVNGTVNILEDVGDVRANNNAGGTIEYGSNSEHH